jgi:hypothetical protein
MSITEHFSRLKQTGYFDTFIRYPKYVRLILFIYGNIYFVVWPYSLKPCHSCKLVQSIRFETKTDSCGFLHQWSYCITIQ